MSETKRKNRANRRINNTLLVLLLVTMVGMLGAFGWNIYNIFAKDGDAEETVIVAEKPENEFINEYYTIGHNATDINKEYFRELNAALDANDTKAVAEAVTKCFVTEYYTWTNKDGNYDVGGMQYIYTDDQRDFEVYSRYNFYADMDLYINQLGSKNLIQVANVTINSCDPSEYTTDEGETKTDYTVNASWTYEESSMSKDGVQNSAAFKVVDHNGRMEIAEID